MSGQTAYEFDWLGNQTLWNDDQNAFHERSLTTSNATDGIVNGHDVGTSSRPAAMYFASNIDHLGAVDPLVDRGGFTELEYGDGGNVLSVTVRGQCRDTLIACDDPGGTNVSSRASTLRGACECDVEQHFQYRWDELNRLSEARRYDRGDTRSNWELQVRQQYRYDGANVRMVKRTLDGFTHGASQYATDGLERAALYVYPGDFERRGLTSDLVNDEYDASSAACGSMGTGGGSICTETQYLIAGARLVWRDPAAFVLSTSSSPSNIVPEARLTYALPDLLRSSVAVVDLFSGDLIERSTYLPNGARETMRTTRDANVALEPMGFTGKEGDDEVGLIYFGERYLMPHLGRWASPDPLQVHAGGGGEFGNSFQYVGGNLLQARDPNGLCFGLAALWCAAEALYAAGAAVAAAGMVGVVANAQEQGVDIIPHLPSGREIADRYLRERLPAPSGPPPPGPPPPVDATPLVIAAVGVTVVNSVIRAPGAEDVGGPATLPGADNGRDRADAPGVANGELVEAPAASDANPVSVPGRSGLPDRLETSQFNYANPDNRNNFIMGTLIGGQLEYVIERGGGDVSGRRLFEMMVEHFGIENIQVIQSNWNPTSTNTARVLEAQEHGATLENAIRQAPGGRYAIDHGFTESRVVSGTPEGDGTFVVEFSRPDE